jgi:hypothetical protein
MSFASVAPGRRRNRPGTAGFAGQRASQQRPRSRPPGTTCERLVGRGGDAPFRLGKASVSRARVRTRGRQSLWTPQGRPPHEPFVVGRLRVALLRERRCRCERRPRCRLGRAASVSSGLPETPPSPWRRRRLNAVGPGYRDSSRAQAKRGGGEALALLAKAERVGQSSRCPVVRPAAAAGLSK